MKFDRCGDPQYTEFTAYAALLSGAPPTVLQRSLVAHHPHLWKLREHHLYAPDDPDAPEVRPIAPGNPLRGYIPNGCQFSEQTDGIIFQEGGRAEPVVYQSWSSIKKNGRPPGKLIDVFVTGEVCTLYWPCYPMCSPNTRRATQPGVSSI